MERVRQILKAAIKNVWFNKKQYVFFAILLIFVQSLISCVILFSHNNSINETRFLEEEYALSVGEGKKTYHIVLNNMNEIQRAEVLTAYTSVQSSSQYFHPIVVESVKSGTSVRYNMYIYFGCQDQPNRTPYQLYTRFLDSALYRESLSTESGNPVLVQETPLLEASKAQVINASVTALICVAITALGTVMFALLFNTVVNHFKFSYGIYMTFGANFFKLLTTALCEMLVVNLLTFIPSFLLSILITFLLTLRAGYGISILIYPMFLALLCSLILTTVAVFMVMLKLSRQTPNNLIRSVNNVGLITSPRVSKRIPRNGFPFKSELLSLVRFRKYVLSLVLSTLIFAGAFCGGIFVVNAQTQKENLVRPQFELSFPSGGFLHGDVITTAAVSEEETPVTTSAEEEITPPYEYATGYTYTPEVKAVLSSIEGVAYILKDRTLAASQTETHSHVMIPSNRLTVSAKMDGITLNDGYHGYVNVDYKLLDEEVVDNLRYLGYTITGDIDGIFGKENTIVISDSYNNTQKNKLKVGDTVRIAVASRYRKKLPSDPPVDYKELLKNYINCFYFDYEEFTVGAILSDVPDNGSFSVYLQASDFEQITRTSAYFVDVQLVCDDNISEETLRNLQTRLYTLSQEYKMTIVNTDYDTAKRIDEIKNLPGILLYVSCLVLVVSVLIMALSQALFYQMRKQEFDIYLCLGADFKMIRKLFLVDAGFFAVISAVFYSIFAFIADYIFYKIANINLGTAEVRFAFHVPLGAFFIGLAVTVLSSALCVMNAYRSFKKKSEPVFTGAKVVAAEQTGDRKNQSDIFDSDVR